MLTQFPLELLLASPCRLPNSPFCSLLTQFLLPSPPFAASQCLPNSPRRSPPVAHAYPIPLVAHRLLNSPCRHHPLRPYAASHCLPNSPGRSTAPCRSSLSQCLWGIGHIHPVPFVIRRPPRPPNLAAYLIFHAYPRQVKIKKWELHCSRLYAP